jgi:hypothetical protein
MESNMNGIWAKIRWLRWALVMLLLGAVSAAAQPPAPGKDGAKGYRTRVYRLKTFDAEKAMEILEELLSEPKDVLGFPGKAGPGGPGFGPPGSGSGPGFGPGVAAPMGFGSSPISPPPLPLPPGVAGGGKSGNAPAGAGGPLPPSLGGSGGGGPLPPVLGDSNSSQRYRLTFDERTNSIVLRAPDQEVQLATELMSVLELPADRAIPGNLNALRAFRLKEADAAKLAEKLQGLGYKARIVAVESLRLLLAAGPAEDLKEIADAITELDGADPEEKGTPPPKKKDSPPAEEEDGAPKRLRP